MAQTNPWVTSKDTGSTGEGSPTAAPVPAPGVAVHPTGPRAPQPGIAAPAVRLPRRTVPGPALMWWLGVHGGAGERTMAALIQDSRTVGHAWPVVATPNVPAPRVVLVARTHARGLLALQAAATEWASGQTGVDLLGAVLIADAPGRLPRPLRDLMSLVSGGVPRTWHVPWMEPWRRGETVTATDVPKPVRTLVTEISDLLK